MLIVRRAAAVAFVLAFALGLATPMMAQDSPTPPFAAPSASQTGRITVTGEGHVFSRPDMATITLGVETPGDSANTALAENTAATTRVLEELRRAGTAPRDMQTSNLTLGPRWTQTEGGESRPAGFIATTMITVTVRDLTRLGSVLDAVVETGANTFQGLTFGLSDPRPRQDEARRAAVADALVKAGLYAEAAGVDLGALMSLTEGGAVSVPPRMMRMAAGAGVPVAEGEVTVDATVTVDFAIRP